ncbi:hypothetical protein RJT34_16859 [Clitoria ternatea]|uniref:Uncharacterized protein n=1 Tax=Clitoria ternatea TaxID=43366 RepID=A0AAN9PD77_CLITE
MIAKWYSYSYKLYNMRFMTAKAAEAAASSAYTMDEHQRIACAKVERVKKDSETQQKVSAQAIQEAHMWRSELAKAREHDVILEAVVLRAEEMVRVAEANIEARIR